MVKYPIHLVPQKQVFSEKKFGALIVTKLILQTPVELIRSFTIIQFLFLIKVSTH